MTDLRSSVNEYLEGLPEAVLSRLYLSPATCLAIFRLLPSLAKMLVLSMLFREEPLKLVEIDAFVKSKSKRLQGEALKKLHGLHIIRAKHAAGAIILNNTFRTSIRGALAGGDSGNSFGIPCETDDKYKVDIDFLDRHATQKWETILHFMVGTDSSQTPNGSVLQLLQHSGLMETVPGEYGMRITNMGFQFLLQDVNAQIWTFLLQYLNMSASLQMDPVDVLNFIFMLGSLELGKDYSLSALSDTQVQMLEDLRDYGIVYQRKSTSRRFYPTRLATSLTSDSTGSARTAAMSMDAAINDTTKGKGSGSGALQGAPITGTGSGFIILETNFRLYAYTDSPLQIAVLNLFVHLKSRFANMVAGQITRDSVRAALMNGIQADQIITYLTVHAHSQMRKNNPILPPTVVDQLKLWQIEMDRIKASEGYLFTNFRSFQEYSLVASYANALGVLLWQSPSKRQFFVTKDGNSQVVEFVNRKMSASS